jgi:hypothetical protein
MSRSSLRRFVDGCCRDLAQFENPTWWEIIRLVTGLATLTGIHSIGLLYIGMALATEARNPLRFC